MTKFRCPKDDAHELSSWTIYERPLDYPDKYVARRFVYGQGSEPIATADMFIGDSVDELRALLPAGLSVVFARDPADHPSVIETWF